MALIDTLRGFGLTTTVTTERHNGEGGAGPLYGGPVELEVYVEHGRKRVRDQAGEEVQSEALIVAAVDVDLPERSRVTLPDGRVGHVVATTVYALAPEDARHAAISLGSLSRA